MGKATRFPNFLAERYISRPWKTREFRMPHLPPRLDGEIPLRIGPGGSLCACCCPAPGSKERRRMVRSARRKAKKDAIRDELKD